MLLLTSEFICGIILMTTKYERIIDMGIVCAILFLLLFLLPDLLSEMNGVGCLFASLIMFFVLVYWITGPIGVAIVVFLVVFIFAKYAIGGFMESRRYHKEQKRKNKYWP